MKEQSASNPCSEGTPAGTKRKSHPFWQVFWLTFLGASLGYAWYSFYVPSNDVDWAEDVASAQLLAADSGKDIMMFFTAEWCVPCRIMKREIFADEEAMMAIHAKVVPVMVHEEDPGAKELFQKYQIGSTPITLFSDPAGNVLDYAVGRIGKGDFLAMLEDLGSEDSTE